MSRGVRNVFSPQSSARANRFRIHRAMCSILIERFSQWYWKRGVPLKLDTIFARIIGHFLTSHVIFANKWPFCFITWRRISLAIHDANVLDFSINHSHSRSNAHSVPRKCYDPPVNTLNYFTSWNINARRIIFNLTHEIANARARGISARYLISLLRTRVYRRLVRFSVVFKPKNINSLAGCQNEIVEICNIRCGFHVNYIGNNQMYIRFRRAFAGLRQSTCKRRSIVKARALSRCFMNHALRQTENSK